MKVLMCITGLHKGGAEKMFYYICSKTSSFGYDYTPIVASFLGGFYEQELKKEKIKMFVLFRDKNVFNIIGRIISYIIFLINERKNIKLIHAFMPHGGLLGSVSNVILKKPFIYSIRNSSFESMDKKNENILRLIRIISHNLAVKYADLLTCNSYFVKNNYEKRIKKDIEIVLNCIEIPESNKLFDENIKRRYFIKKDSFYVVSVCNMRYPQKDIITLLNVAKKANEYEFILVGDGPSLEYFKKYCQNLNLKNVNFTGFQENVFPFLSYSNCYILLTRHEGFPNTVLEAMIAKCPVIISDIPEIYGILKDKENAVFVKNGDNDGIINAINLLKNDKKFRESIVENAFNYVKLNFSVQRMIDENYKTYKKIEGK